MTRMERTKDRNKQDKERLARLAGSFSQMATFVFTVGRWVIEKFTNL